MRLFTSIDGPVAVIGDVHGQTDKLSVILNKLRALPDFEERWIVFIGDLVDRGPDPCSAIEMVIQLQKEHERTTAIAGNHELAMAAAIKLVDTPSYSDWDQRWVAHYGSEQTFISYGAEFGDLEELRSKVPDEHQQFLADIPWSVEHPDFFFVHAGLSPNQPYKVQQSILRERDFSLNRPEWLCSKSLIHAAPPDDCPHVVVSGHVQVPHVQFSSRKILIDTTGGFHGDLSCVLLPEGRVITSGSASYSASDVRRQKAAPPKQKSGWFDLW